MGGIIPKHLGKGYYKRVRYGYTSTDDVRVTGARPSSEKQVIFPAVHMSMAELEKTDLDKSNQRVRRMFSQIASRYDRMNHLLSMNIDHYWRWRTVRKVAPLSNAPILDVCSGTGDLALAYCRKSSPDTEIIGADFTREMLQIGERKKQKRKRFEKVRFVEADAQHLPFADNTFQIVSVAFGLRNIADTDRGLQEMFRVCLPGGRVAVLEFSQPTWQPFRAFYGCYMKYILPRIGQWLAGNDEQAYNYLPDSVSTFPFGQQLADRMQSNGWVDASFFPLTGGIATLYIASKPKNGS